jgi:hypothetical protein
MTETGYKRTAFYNKYSIATLYSGHLMGVDVKELF